ncbi:cation:proton antiporter [Gallaecimonas sp. GXIMD4217]|uniref:cation:proton antiporter domain-containing protein n=1 Tax=Gallaecimonas sp. GXIMD4217 TaxID=3131927 RepID=UPI00311B0421
MLSLLAGLLLLILVLALLLRLVRLPLILAYLLAGMLAGSQGLGWLQEGQQLSELAELGIVLLLFSLGLDFSVARIRALGRRVWLGGAAQVSLVVVMVLGLIALGGGEPGALFFVALAAAMSSTAVVMRELSRRKALKGRRAQSALAILLFQDLLAVPVLAWLSASGQQGPWYELLGLVLAQVLAFLVLALTIGWWLLPRVLAPLFRLESTELLLIAALGVVMGAAALAHGLGISSALGAFVAGLVLAGTPFKHQFDADIRPFRDLLMGLFLVVVGSQLDPAWLWSHLSWVLMALAALIAVKLLAGFLALRLVGEAPRDARDVALALCQLGELGLVILAVAELPAQWQQLGVSLAVLTMAMTPALVKIPYRHPRVEAEAGVGHDAQVLILGFGRVGQVLAQLLGEAKIPFLVVDLEPVRVAAAARKQIPILLGDARSADLLKQIGIRNMKLVVVTFGSAGEVNGLVPRLRSLAPTAEVLVRVPGQAQLKDPRLGGAQLVCDELEGLHAMAKLMLNQLPLEGDKRAILMTHLRDKTRGRAGARLWRAWLLAPRHGGCGHSLAELGLWHGEVRVQRLERQGGELARSPGLVLESGDLLIMEGPAAAVNRACERLRAGPELASQSQEE